MDYKYNVSVIIPHYNTPDLLGKLLSTIPNKDDIQIIIIDDHSDNASKDRLYDILRKYSSRNILCLDNNTQEHNAGVSRNIGLDHAEGKWLLFADADDYFLPDLYEKISSYFDSDYDLVYFPPISKDVESNMISFRHIGYVRHIYDYLRDPSPGTEAVLRFRWIPVWSRLIRASLVRKNNIRFESVKYANDEMFSTQLGFYAKTISISDETIYCLSYRAGSLTNDRGKAAFDVRSSVKIRKFKFLKAHLNKQEFYDAEAFRISIVQLLIIIHRRYGLRYLIKYLKIFADNGMLIFDNRLINPAYIANWVHNYINDHKVKQKFIKARQNTKVSI